MWVRLGGVQGEIEAVPPSLASCLAVPPLTSSMRPVSPYLMSPAALCHKLCLWCLICLFLYCLLHQPALSCLLIRPALHCLLCQPGLHCLMPPSADPMLPEATSSTPSSTVVHRLIVTPSTAAYFLAPFVGAMNLARTTQALPVLPTSAVALHIPHPLLPIPPSHYLQHSLPPPATPVPLILILWTSLFIIYL